MLSLSLLFKPLNHPHKSLIAVFVLWKSLLLLIAASSPGPGYDTSTTLAQLYDGTAEESQVVSLLRFFSTKLTRWDAIYFTKIASRNYLYEQEWAFGWGFTRLIRFFSSDFKRRGYHQGYGFWESFVAIGLAHTAHGLSVLALYSLTKAIFRNRQSTKIAFITACLHIFSPAGIFLSAPYGESTFALLSFLAYLLFVNSFSVNGHATAHQDFLLVVAGIFLGFATTVRSNGLLNGLLFLEEAIRNLYFLITDLEVPALRRLVAAGIGGACVAAGFLLPQFIAFKEFCGEHSYQTERVWCKSIFPSIYIFVQSYYWNLGFLRYWTLSNIPLFILAFPVLTIMIESCIWAARMSDNSENMPKLLEPMTNRPESLERRLLRSLAAPQLLLAILAFTNYHVQIISRISSGYCIWYFWLAHAIIGSMKNSPASKVDRSSRGRLMISTNIVMYIVMYAAVQAGLFSSFLPPA